MEQFIPLEKLVEAEDVLPSKHEGATHCRRQIFQEEMTSKRVIQIVHQLRDLEPNVENFGKDRKRDSKQQITNDSPAIWPPWKEKKYIYTYIWKNLNHNN